MKNPITSYQPRRFMVPVIHQLVWWPLIFSFLGIIACQNTLEEDVQVYVSDFASGDLSNITNGTLTTFQGKAVIGFYHNDTVKLSLRGLPAHDALKITVELYVHDSWDGNVTGVGGPDLWMMELEGDQVLRTTFSNSPCTSSYCLYQSFPGNHPSFNRPKTGATSGELPGRCQYQNVAGWSSVYHITRTIPHRGYTAEFVFRDEIKQTNARNQLCDESWSLGQITVSTVSFR
ncbi:MAG: hypothetical protein JJU34_02180 [Lunatimonas sp.]|uniref:hypothetical protein n=1 Tax=Lunatimonas sp. TaxID=2060141 RepID=UPI00263BCB5D|nr:hypothetical protein [Lunatimonas sp.]MCC5936067.1 hypothetical protein [Lunatimonas sp.]